MEKKPGLAAILKHGEKKLWLKECVKELKRPTDQMMKIVAARNSGASFCELNELEARVAIDQIMFRGAAITGCPLPHTELFAKFIAEEISTYILEFGYEELTEAEILLAMRINTLGRWRNIAGDDMEQVSFSGNSFNVAYLGKILRNYKTIRDNMDLMIKNKLDGY